MDQVEADAAYINVITSDDPVIIAKVQAHANKTTEAFAAMESGHDHDH